MFLDTTILVEMLRRTPTHPLVQRIRAALRNERLFCSVIQYGELADYARKAGEPTRSIVQRAQAFLESVPVDEETAIAASDLKAEARRHKASRDFSLIDGLILASARRRGQRLLTLAQEFRPFPEAIVLDANAP